MTKAITRKVTNLGTACSATSGLRLPPQERPDVIALSHEA